MLLNREDLSSSPIESLVESLEELDPLANHHVAATQLALLDPLLFDRYKRLVEETYQLAVEEPQLFNRYKRLIEDA